MEVRKWFGKDRTDTNRGMDYKIGGGIEYDDEPIHIVIDQHLASAASMMAGADVALEEQAMLTRMAAELQQMRIRNARVTRKDRKRRGVRG